MAGEKLLDNPYLQAKYAKLLRPHIHTEELMNKWHNEPSSAHDEAPEPRGANAGASDVRVKPISKKMAKKLEPLLDELLDASKEKSHVAHKRRPRNRRRRKVGDRKEDKPSKARGQAAKASGSNGHVDVAGGEADTYGWIYQGLEEEVKEEEKKDA
jgi:hypothetical protein